MISVYGLYHFPVDIYCVEVEGSITSFRVSEPTEIRGLEL